MNQALKLRASEFNVLETTIDSMYNHPDGEDPRIKQLPYSFQRFLAQIPSPIPPHSPRWPGTSTGSRGAGSSPRSWRRSTATCGEGPVGSVSLACPAPALVGAPAARKKSSQGTDTNKV